MEEYLKPLAEQLGLSLVNTALLTGVLAGFILRSLFASKSNNTSAHPGIARTRVSSSPGSVHLTQGPQVSITETKLEISPQQMQHIKELLRQGNKIEAIKEFRAITNLGLAEAKSAIDAIDGKF